MLQGKLSSVLIAKYAYITGGSKHPAKTMSLASNEHIDNQCCNTWCNYCSAAVAAAAATAVPGGSSSFSVLWGTAAEGRVTDLVRGGSRDWPSLAALTTEPTTTYDRRHGQCSLQSPNFSTHMFQYFSTWPPPCSFLYESNKIYHKYSAVHLYDNLIDIPLVIHSEWKGCLLQGTIQKWALISFQKVKL